MKTPQYTLITLIFLAVLASTSGCMDSGKLQTVTVTPAEAIIVPGASQQFRATAHFSDGTTLDWTTASEWTIVKDEGVDLEIGKSLGIFGLVTTTTGTGKYKVLAKDAANNITGTADFYVVAPQTIQIVPPSPFMPQNSSHQFSAITTLPAVLTNGTTTVVYDLTSLATWSVSDEQVAFPDVTKPGVITTLASAATKTADLVAIYSGITYTAKLTVTPEAVKSVTIDQQGDEVALQTTTQFTATGVYGSNYPNPPLTPEPFTSSVVWSSSNPDIEVASIDSANGLVTAGTKTGTTTIKALDPVSGLSAEKTLTVIP